ncbi:glycosyltransferase family 4 protein [Moorena producens]|uniref:glycosyltransferase family 4 protein n=1 Tax=Moorena producens TaxID=1155739 RepID=UPI003C716BC0
MCLKIAIIAHGRFYAFDLARELINQGHHVILLTNYPSSIVERYGVPRQHVKSFLLHGILSRLTHRLHKLKLFPDCESWLSPLFSRWAATILKKNPVDVVHCFSGVAEELFQGLQETHTLKTLVRGSSHIQVQSQILLEEERRAGTEIDKPSSWIIKREQREYQLASLIIVLSCFAYESFLQQGIDYRHLQLLPLGARLQLFRPPLSIIRARIDRILSGQRLQILMVGNFSLQKGAIDLIKLAAITRSFCDLRFVGSITRDAAHLVSEASQFIEFIPRQPESDLPTFYNWADIFVFTTLQDGYAVVLSQAQAAGLPILATRNCAAPDILHENETGWVLPIRSPETFAERLQWCHKHRQELAQMVQQVYDNFAPRDWTDVATDFVSICTELIKQK